MGDFGGDSSLDGVIVGVLRRFKLFWILHGQGYKPGPPGPHQEHKEHQEDPRMGDFGGDGSLDGMVSRYQGDSSCSGTPSRLPSFPKSPILGSS